MPKPTTIRLSKSAAIDLDSDEFKSDGLRIWLTGEPGSGKSNAAMLIASQWLESKRQLLVLDSHGEYSELWKLLPAQVIRIGYGDAPVNVDSADWVMSFIKEGKSVLLDLSHWTNVDSKPLDKFIRTLMSEVYRYRRQHPAEMLVLVEEAQEFAPQMQSSGQSDNVKNFIGMLTGGRKFGLHFLLSSQRQSLVDINVIAQCNVRIFMRISELSDWKKIRGYMPERFPVSFGTKTKTDIARFTSGEAVLISRWWDPVRTRLPMAAGVSVTKFLEEAS